MQKLFVCYANGSRADVDELAAEIRLRGVPVWIDHDCGFNLGDNCQTEARRVIADPSETFGLTFYATPDLFKSDFIKRIELHEAIGRKDRDPYFRLSAILCGMDFKGLSDSSMEHFGYDLSAFHSSHLPRPRRKGEVPSRKDLGSIAVAVLRDRLSILRMNPPPNGLFGVNFCTRDSLPPSEDDHLWIDATRILGDDGNCPENWDRLTHALEDVRRELRAVLSRPKIRLRGSKHLTAAFLFGRTFTPSVAPELFVQQGAELWSSECESRTGESLKVQLEDSTPSDARRLFVGVTATGKPVRGAVRRYAASAHIKPMSNLWLDIGDERPGPIDNASAVAIATQARHAILEAVQSRGAQEIYLFMAVPQGVAVFLGRLLNATPPIRLHEYDGADYRLSAQWI